MNKVKELLAKKAEKEGKVEKGKEKEIAGRRKDAKKGESREDRTKRVSKKMEEGHTEPNNKEPSNRVE